MQMLCHISHTNISHLTILTELNMRRNIPPQYWAGIPKRHKVLSVTQCICIFKTINLTRRLATRQAYVFVTLHALHYVILHPTTSARFYNHTRGFGETLLDTWSGSFRRTMVQSSDLQRDRQCEFYGALLLRAYYIILLI